MTEDRHLLPPPAPLGVGAPTAERLSAAIDRYLEEVTAARIRLLEATEQVGRPAGTGPAGYRVEPGIPASSWPAPDPGTWVPGPPL